jgi:hypothetical protein
MPASPELLQNQQLPGSIIGLMAKKFKPETE